MVKFHFYFLYPGHTALFSHLQSTVDFSFYCRVSIINALSLDKGLQDLFLTNWFFFGLKKIENLDIIYFQFSIFFFISISVCLLACCLIFWRTVYDI